MYKEKSVGVVVPAYNEELLIGRVIEAMPPLVDKIIIVDDCSSDQTYSIVEKYMNQYPERIVLIRHEDNQGVGGAIITGYKWCRDEGIDATVVMIPCEPGRDSITPVTIHAATRQQINFRLKTRRFIHE